MLAASIGLGEDDAVMATQRLKELILYIAERMEHDDHVGRGRIKLAKLLFRSDFEAFAKLGEPITEAHYQADKLGPSPRQELLAIRDLGADLELRSEWDKQQIPIAKRSPRLDLFSQEQLAIVDKQLTRYRDVSARAMVDEAHEFIGWRLAWRDGAGLHADVPYESIFWDSRSDLKPWEEEHAAELAKRP